MKSADIREALLAEIGAGKFAATGRLPSEAALCRRFGAARGTVREALAALVRAGLVAKRNGAGSFLTRMAQNRTGLIGLAIPDYDRYRFFATVRDRIEALAHRAGFDVRLVTGGDLPQAARRLVSERAEGVIFRPLLARRGATANRAFAERLKSAGIPLVLLDQDIAAPPERSEYDLVAVNNVNAGRRIASHLLARGRRRVAFLMGPRATGPNPNWENRLFGLTGELALRGVNQAVRILRFEPGNAAALRRAMLGPRRPDAIVCGNDENAVALLATLRGAGLRVPDDVALVGFDDLECARFCEVPLTTVRQPAQLIASAAIRMLLARIRNPESSPRETCLPAPLVVRDSTETQIPQRATTGAGNTSRNAGNPRSFSERTATEGETRQLAATDVQRNPRSSSGCQGSSMK